MVELRSFYKRVVLWSSGHGLSICQMLLRFLRLVWALPWTLGGLILGLAALATGGRCQRVGRVLEFHGGALQWLLKRVPICGGAAAMTLGHVVVARTKADLDRSRPHELVHVAQY